MHCTIFFLTIDDVTPYWLQIRCAPGIAVARRHVLYQELNDSSEFVCKQHSQGPIKFAEALRVSE